MCLSKSRRNHSPSFVGEYGTLPFNDSICTTCDARLEVRAGVIAAVVGAVEAALLYSVRSVNGVEPFVIIESDRGAVRGLSTKSCLGLAFVSISGAEADRYVMVWRAWF